jgi:hypothetical protein
MIDIHAFEDRVRQAMRAATSHGIALASDGFGSIARDTCGAWSLTTQADHAELCPMSTVLLDTSTHAQTMAGAVSELTGVPIGLVWLFISGFDQRWPNPFRQGYTATMADAYYRLGRQIRHEVDHGMFG